jgi:hypothetical protein
MRGAAVLVGATSTTPQRLVGLHERLRAIQRPVRRGTLIAQLALVGAATLASVL